MAFYVGGVAHLSALFEVDGVPTDPTTVSLIITDPTGEQTTIDGGDLSHDGDGAYSYDLALPMAGDWVYVFIGAGDAAAVQPGTFRVLALPAGQLAARLYDSVAAWKLWAATNTNYFTNALGESLDGLIEECIAAASRRIDADTGRVFYLTEGEARLFRVGDNGRVRFVDLVVTDDMEVLVDLNVDDVPETALAATDYLLLPLTDSRGRASLRYNSMRTRRGASRILTPGQMVQITTDWGYVEADGSVPADIVMACRIEAGRAFARREAKLGAVSVPNLGTVGMVKGADHQYWEYLKDYILSDEEPMWGLT